MRRGVLAVTSVLAAGLAAFGCDEHFPDPVVHGIVPPPLDDAGAEGGVDPDAGTPITVVSHAPAAEAGALGAPASVTWAAYADDLGWHSLMPSAVGTYTFRVASARWSVALVCAAPGNAEVVIASRSTNLRSLDLQAAGLCTAIPPATFRDLEGTVTNAPPTTTFFEFGYGNGNGNKAITVDGTGTGPYVLFGVQTGLTDLAFGTRDTEGGPLTKMAILRQRTVPPSGGDPIDVDFASGFVPGKKAITLEGLDATEAVIGQVKYTTTGHSLGIGMAPTTLGSTFDYGTVPAAARVSGDQYRLEVTAARTDESLRTVTASFVEPVDLALVVPPPLDSPTHTILKQPYQRIETIIAFVPPIALTTIDAVAMPSPSSRFRWLTTTDLSSALDITMPDLAVVPGFDPAWALPFGTSVKVTVTRDEPSTVVGDGTRSRSSSRTTLLSGE